MFGNNITEIFYWLENETITNDACTHQINWSKHV